MPILIDLVGQRFGRLIVIRKMDRDKWRNYLWLCECDCGRKKIIYGYNLRTGRTKSCGCLQKEMVTKHGHNQNGEWSKTYNRWHSMIQRCTNTNNKRYKDYGGRGITVCHRWMKFENFLADMGETPPGLQIDRIKNDLGYSKENCRWVTSKEQQRNKRNNHLVTYERKTQCLSACAEEYNISFDTLWSRICKYHWSTERAITTPVRKRRKSNG